MSPLFLMHFSPSFRTQDLRFFVLCLDLRRKRKNQSRDQRETFSQRPKFQSQKRHKFVSTLSSSSSRQRRLNSTLSPNKNNFNERLSLSLSLSLSLLRSHRHVRESVLCVRFSLSNVRDTNACSPLLKRTQQKVFFRVYEKP